MIKFLRLVACFLILLSVKASASAATGGAWYGARTKNFIVLSHAGERHAATLAARLEEFRAVFSSLLEKDYFDSDTPTVALLFANSGEYDEFRPRHHGQIDGQVAGYFQPSPEVNYITLAAASAAETEATLFHEYVHLLISNRFERAPLWFDEGLSEYYSVYDLIDGGKRVRFGKTLPSRFFYLRTHEWLPLETILTADKYSELYHDHDRRGVFYAESWALVHYLLSDSTGERARQLDDFLRLCAEGETPSDAIKKAFGVAASELEGRLKEYVRSARLPERAATINLQLKNVADSQTGVSASQNGGVSSIQTWQLKESESESYLGDLLLRAERDKDARAHLEAALKLDLTLSAANLSLGSLLMRENRLTEAKDRIIKAIETNANDYLAHFRYAEFLLREGGDEKASVTDYLNRTALIRDELMKTIQLHPRFTDAYALLAAVESERGQRVEEAEAMIREAMRRNPKRREFEIILARIYARKGEFDAARNSLTSLIDERNVSESVKFKARGALDALKDEERIAIERKKLNEDEAAAQAAKVSSQNKGRAEEAQPCDMPEPGPQFKPARFAGKQVCGRLIEIECDATGALVRIQTNERTITLHGASLERIRFITYVRAVKGKITCGQREAREAVLATFRPTEGGRFDGEAIAVEFVPDDWLH